MRIATVGKGGSGKTTIAGTLARIFAADGRRILAIDGDPNPNLALMLGMAPDAANKLGFIPPSVIKKVDRADGTAALELALPQDDLLQRYAQTAARNVDLIVMGRPTHGTAGTGCMCMSHRTVRELIAHLTNIRDHTITDMEAGLEHLKRGTARHVDMMLIVAEPYYRSLEAASRTHELALELGIPYVKVVANKVRNAEDRAAIDSYCAQHGMEVIGWVPQDEALITAERQGFAPYDAAANSVAVSAIRVVADEITRLGVAIPPRRPRPSAPTAQA
jgi:CO dehydrogenase maturation factor